MELRRPVIAASLAFALLLRPLAAPALPLEPGSLPAPLAPWTAWVLHGQEEKTCPFLHGDGESRLCAWPSSLRLDLDGAGGSFSQVWDMSLEGWALLPGDASHWPGDVVVDGRPAVVTGAPDRPRTLLGPGRHVVEGAFRWEALPEALSIPAATGLLLLDVEGAPVDSPLMDGEGRLWLHRRISETAAEERLDVEAFRLVRDTIPMQVLLRLHMRVSGASREILLPGLVGPEAVPLSLSSPLPARVEPDGALRVQVRPGDWWIEAGMRYRGPVSELVSAPLPPPWPREEIWSFEAAGDLRVVEPGGTASPVDPQQTTLPEEWRRFPAWLVRPGETLTLVEKRRGDPEPPPDILSLQRTIWLQMDGDGYTIRDEMKGVKHTGWRLEVGPPLDLGRVSVGGVEQLITTREGSDLAGVELRRGDVLLVAESTMSRRGSRLPAVGWKQDFAEVGGVLNLPPGWRLFSLRGADRVSNTWVSRWTLLDFFLVLVFSLAIAKLWGRRTGLLALAALVLTYHEPGAPRWIWAHFLVAFALLRVIPRGRFRTALGLWFNALAVALVVVAVPFCVRQARDGLFPQLERYGGPQGYRAYTGDTNFADESANLPAEAWGPATAERKKTVFRGSGSYDALSSYEQAGPAPPAQFDPKAAIQTGKGLPEWSWNSVRFSWTGPVRRGETLSLVLVGPGANLFLAFLRIALLTALVLSLLGVGWTRPGRFDFSRISLFRPALAALLLLLAAVLCPSVLQAQAFPDRETLEELKRRLLEPEECLPSCAGIPAMRIAASPGKLEIDLEIHAAADVAVPLPAAPGQWMPASITAVDTPAPGVLRRDGRLWYLARRGITAVKMTGPLPPLEEVQLPLPLRPRRAEASLEGWAVEGIHENGQVDGQLQLRRTGGGDGPGAGKLKAGALPPLVQVERSLELGLNWVVRTVVRRVSPAGTAVLIEVPLLAGESVAVEGVRTVDGRVLVSMGPSESLYGWESILDEISPILLEAADTDQWTEVWTVNASPIWHLEAEGIPVVHHQREDLWLPEWRPWPGEKVALSLSRPRGVPGQTVTVDRSLTRLSPGRRATEGSLTVALRSSRGGQHPVVLPPDAELLGVTLDGKTRPLRKEGDILPLPLVPGPQTAVIRWRTPRGVDTLLRPETAGLSIGSVNATVEVEVPGDRWVLLTGGPRFGPAVLWWGLLAVTALAALILGRIPGSPLGSLSWFLLGVGLSQAGMGAAAVVVGWLLALRLRRELPAGTPPARFDLVQIVLAAATAAAVAALVAAVSKGLLGYPSLQISGNGSTSSLLRWYSDNSGEALPRVWALSAPMYVYRALMLAWSLWAAFALLRWLRYGWESFSSGGVLWKPTGWRLRRGRKAEKTSS